MESPLLDKSYKFALNIIHVYQKVSSEKKEFVLSKQLLRSGTSVGANIEDCEELIRLLVSILKSSKNNL